MVDFAGAAEAVVDIFGEDVVYESSDGRFTIPAVFRSEAHRVQGSRGPAITSKRPELTILQSAMRAEPVEGDRVTVRSALYTVASVRQDAEATRYLLGLKRV